VPVYWFDDGDRKDGMDRTAADEALLAVARMAMDASVRAADDLGELSPVQLRALTGLRHAEGTNLAGLAEDMGVTVSTASRLVDRLVSAEWVNRRPSPHNGREISLSLTEAGASLLRRFDDRRLLRLRDYLARVAPERQGVVVEALSELAARV
jgi:DNA-binding MarR family transcriptional regulator